MIIIKELCKSFTNNKAASYHALKNINLRVEDGECIIINGVSGSGKSTLLHIIASLMKPTSGAVEVDGDNIVSLPDFYTSEYRKNKLGLITQSFHLFDELSVKDNILIPLVLTKLNHQETDKRVVKTMEIANITHKATQKVSTLSGGEKQRCVIARALVNQPDIILCDEPTANLDKQNILIFIDIVTKLKEMGKTVIIATHDPIFEKLPFVNRMIFLKDGSFE